MVNDPISDYLTRIRNALLRYKKDVLIPHSKIKFSLSKILKENGFIDDFEVVTGDGKPALSLKLKYDENNQSVINELKRVSKPGRRIYCSVDKIPRVKNGIGIAVLSTPKGILKDEDARKANVSGEIICQVW